MESDGAVDLRRTVILGAAEDPATDHRRKVVTVVASGLRSRLLRRVALPLTVLAFTGYTALAPAPAFAAAPTAVDSAQAASGWLAGQMVDGNRLQNFGLDDAGLTIDAMVGFASAGVEKDRVAAALTWLSDPAVLSDYMLQFTSINHASQTAKVIFGIQVAGGDPTKVNGTDLVAILNGMLVTSGPTTGLFQNSTPAGPGEADSTNAFGQSLAILALARTPGGAPASAVDFLVSTQCDSGGFPITLTDPPATCQGDPDGTAMAVQALLAAGHGDDAKEAVAWLVKQVDPVTGGVKPGFQGGTFNTNSTGLVAEALRAFGDDAPADKASAFIERLQIGCAGDSANRGGIAYIPTDPADPDNTGFNLSTAPRATAQAILGLTGVALGKITIDGAKPGATPLNCTTATPTPSTTITGAAGLPVTGASLTAVLIAGAGLIVVGVSLLFVIRGRRDATSL
jgi:hypothetical protein